MEVENEKQKNFNVTLAQNLSEYGEISISVPAGASKEDIIKAAKIAAEQQSQWSWDENLFLNGSENMEGRDSVSGLRIVEIYPCGNESGEDSIATDIPVETQTEAIGKNVIDAIKRLKLGETTDSQFILETLQNTRRYSSDEDVEEIITDEFIAHYANLALKDTTDKIDGLLCYQHPSGNLLDDPAQIVMTVKLDNGEIENRTLRSPGIVMGHGDPLPVYHPYKAGDKVALVFRDISKTEDPDPVTAIYPDGRREVFESVTAFNKTGMLRVIDYAEGMDIIQRIEHLIERPAPLAVSFEDNPESDEMTKWGGYNRP